MLWSASLLALLESLAHLPRPRIGPTRKMEIYATKRDIRYSDKAVYRLLGKDAATFEPSLVDDKHLQISLHLRDTIADKITPVSYGFIATNSLPEQLLDLIPALPLIPPPIPLYTILPSLHLHRRIRAHLHQHSHNLNVRPRTL